MATSPSRVGWDSCTWIAHIQRERILGPDGKTVIEDRGVMCRSVLETAERGIVEIVISAICLVEVLARNRSSGIDDQKVRDFFDNDYILLVNVDKQVGDFARRLMPAGHAGLKPPDALHLATACITNAEAFHTFDGRLLALDGMIDKADGTRLRVWKRIIAMKSYRHARARPGHPRGRASTKPLKNLGSCKRVDGRIKSGHDAVL